MDQPETILPHSIRCYLLFGESQAADSTCSPLLEGSSFQPRGKVNGGTRVALDRLGQCLKKEALSPS